MVVLSLSIQDVVIWSPACFRGVKPKILKWVVIALLLESENHGSLGYDLNDRDPILR
jgi:hypothetical protein